MYKSVFSIESTLNTTNPEHPGIQRLPRGSPTHTGAQLHIFPNEARETQPSLPGSFPPSSESVSRLAPECSERLLEARRQEAGTKSARTQTAPAPRTPDNPPVPALIPSRSTQLGARWWPGPPPPPARAAHRARTLAPFARPELRLKAESPSTVPRTCTPTIRGDREEASILTGAWLCPQTYRALRAPLPPLEDAPPPPPGRAGWSREERGESAEICSAPTPAPAPSWPGLGSPRCAGAARLLGGPIAARPPGRSLSGRPPPPLASLMSTDSEKELGVRG